MELWQMLLIWWLIGFLCCGLFVYWDGILRLNGLILVPFFSCFGIFLALLLFWIIVDENADVVIWRKK